MSGDICPLCAGPAASAASTDFNKDNSHLKDIIYKHLRISFKEKNIHYVCEECGRMVILWDDFASKCWEIQNRLEEKSNMKPIEYIKVERQQYLEIKVEPFDEPYLSSNNEDDKFSISENYTKYEDPLSNVKDKNKLLDGKKKSRHKKRKKENEFINIDNNKSNTSFIEFICHVCSVSLKNWPSLKRHCLNDHSTKPKVLCVCGKYLSSDKSIKAHKEAHDEKQRNNFRCEHCNKLCFDSRGLNYHIMANHTPEEEYPYGCDKCPKRFFNVRLFKQHKSRHLPPDLQEKHACHICNTILSSKSSLKTHISFIHDNVEDHICDICGLNYASKGSLITHRLTHTDKREFKCEKCFKGFKTKDVLKRHEQVHDEGLYKCPECPVVLKNPRGLKAHKVVHDNILKFCCKVCGKRFRRNQQLKIHYNSHNGVKSYKCPWCSKAFTNNQNLKLHKKGKHPHEFNEHAEINTDSSIYSEVETY